MKFKKVLDILLKIYFWGMGIFFIFGAAVSLLVYFTGRGDFGLITAIKTLIFGILFLYSGKQISKHKYIPAIWSLAVVFLITVLHRLFFITNFQLGIVDLQNLLLFGIPFLVILTVTGHLRQFGKVL